MGGRRYAGGAPVLIGAISATCVWMGSGEPVHAIPASDMSPSAATQPLNELFVLTAGAGTLHKLSRKRHTFALTLSTRAAVAFFTDRPQRRAGVEPVARFVSRWKTLGFDQTPPNAALELAHGTHPHDVKVFELRGPRYDARTGELTFRANDLGDRTSTALTSVLRNAHRDIPARFHNATLFIDPSSSASSPQSVKVGMTVPPNAVPGLLLGDLHIRLGHSVRLPQDEHRHYARGHDDLTTDDRPVFTGVGSG